MKSKLIALILSITVGAAGLDRFYLGYTGIGVLKLLTVGCFGILYLVDIYNIATGKLKPADGSEYGPDFVVGTVNSNTNGISSNQNSVNYTPDELPEL